MLPAETRLLPLCLRYLQIHYLEVVPPPYPFPVDDNPALSTIAKSDPGTIPILLKINNEVVNDNFYAMKATLEEGLGVVQKGVIKVMEWSLSIKADGLELKILKAITITNAATFEFLLSPLDRNPSIHETLHQIRFKAVRKLALALPTVIAADSDSDIAETPPVVEKPVLVTPVRRVAQKQTGTPVAAPLVAVTPAAVEKQRPPEPMEVEPQSIPSTSRKRRTPQNAPSSPYIVKKAKFATEPEEPLEKFPEYALEYLKFYYNS